MAQINILLSGAFKLTELSVEYRPASRKRSHRAPSNPSYHLFQNHAPSTSHTIDRVCERDSLHTGSPRKCLRDIYEQ